MVYGWMMRLDDEMEEGGYGLDEGGYGPAVLICKS